MEAKQLSFSFYAQLNISRIDEKRIKFYDCATIILAVMGIIALIILFLFKHPVAAIVFCLGCFYLASGTSIEANEIAGLNEGGDGSPCNCDTGGF